MQFFSHSASYFSRLIRWLQKPYPEQKRLFVTKIKSLYALPFNYGGDLGKVFLVCHPDSYVAFNAHPEFKILLNRFTDHNKLNNSGDITRLWSFILNLKQIVAENIEGDFAELGVWKGNTAAILAHIASAAKRQVFLFDTFEGFDPKDLKGIDDKAPMAFDDTSIQLVKDVIGENCHACHFVKGYFPLSINEVHKSRTYAAVSLDCDLYEPMKAGLNFFYPLMPRGGLFLLHDYSSLYWAGAKQAIDEFCKERDEFPVLLPDKSGSAFIRKSKSHCSDRATD